MSSRLTRTTQQDTISSLSSQNMCREKFYKNIHLIFPGDEISEGLDIVLHHFLYCLNNLNVVLLSKQYLYCIL